MTIAARRRAFLPRLRCLVCNEQELGGLIPGDWSSRSPEALAAELPALAQALGLRDLVITLGKRGDLHAKRQAFSYLHSRDVVAKLFDSLSKQYAERQGGYTKMVNEVWLTVAPLEVLIDRLHKSRGMDKNDVMRRIRTQLSINELRHEADNVITTTNPIPYVAERVRYLYNHLK